MNDEAVKKIRCLILYMVVVDFADSECEASAKSCYMRGHGVPVYC